MVTPHALVTDPIGGPVVQAGEKPAGGGARWVGPAGVAVVKRTGTAGSHVCAWVPQDGGDGTDAEVRRRAACAASRLRGLNPPLRSPAPRARAPRGPRVPAYPRPPAAGPPIDRGCGTSVRLLGGVRRHGRAGTREVFPPAGPRRVPMLRTAPWHPLSRAGERYLPSLQGCLRRAHNGCQEAVAGTAGGFATVRRELQAWTCEAGDLIGSRGRVWPTPRPGPARVGDRCCLSSPVA